MLPGTAGGAAGTSLSEDFFAVVRRFGFAGAAGASLSALAFDSGLVLRAAVLGSLLAVVFLAAVSVLDAPDLLPSALAVADLEAGFFLGAAEASSLALVSVFRLRTGVLRAGLASAWVEAATSGSNSVIFNQKKRYRRVAGRAEGLDSGGHTF